MPKIDKAERRDQQRHRRIHGMRINGKRSMEVILNAIKKKVKR